MKFRYYIIDEDGAITGTDSEKVAIAAADIDSGVLAVLDTFNNRDMTCDMCVPEQTVYSFPDDMAPATPSAD